MVLSVAKVTSRNTLAAVVSVASVFANFFPGTQALAQGEHSRRAGAEIRVMLGDARLLRQYSEANQNPLHRIGLADRLRGGLVTLDILLRLSEQERRERPQTRLTVVNELRQALASENTVLAISELESLASSFVLILPDLKPSTNLDKARLLHQSSCAACHDVPNSDVERPAYNLFEQAAATPNLEMFARMLVGVRGDRVTGLDNPLSDRQIVDLMYLYSQGPSGE